MADLSYHELPSEHLCLKALSADRLRGVINIAMLNIAMLNINVFSIAMFNTYVLNIMMIITYVLNIDVLKTLMF